MYMTFRTETPPRKRMNVVLWSRTARINFTEISTNFSTQERKCGTTGHVRSPRAGARRARFLLTTGPRLYNRGSLMVPSQPFFVPRNEIGLFIKTFGGPVASGYPQPCNDMQSYNL